MPDRSSQGHIYTQSPFNPAACVWTVEGLGFPGRDGMGRDGTGQDRPGQGGMGRDRPGDARPGRDGKGQDGTGQARPGQDRTAETTLFPI